MKAVSMEVEFKEIPLLDYNSKEAINASRWEKFLATNKFAANYARLNTQKCLSIQTLERNNQFSEIYKQVNLISY